MTNRTSPETCQAARFVFHKQRLTRKQNRHSLSHLQKWSVFAIPATAHLPKIEFRKSRYAWSWWLL